MCEKAEASSYLHSSHSTNKVSPRFISSRKVLRNIKGIGICSLKTRPADPLLAKGKTAGLNLPNCWWLISKAILKCFWSPSTLITSMAGAGVLDYSQVISEAEGALNKFLLIFQSISTREQMKKSILPYCIHCARFSAGLDGSLGCVAELLGAFHGCTLGVQQDLCTCAWPWQPVQLQQLCNAL